MDRIKQLENKKLLNELQYIESDFEYKSEVISEADNNFIAKVNEFLSKHPELKDIFDKKANIDIENMIKNAEEELLSEKEDKEDSEDDEDDETIDNLPKSDKIKKIYREIVKLTHPDKVSSKKLNDLYMESTNYYDDNNLPGLYSICNILNIEYEIEESDNVYISDRINSLKQRIDFIQSTFTWKWHHSVDEAERTNILMVYIKSRII